MCVPSDKKEEGAEEENMELGGTNGGEGEGEMKEEEEEKGIIL